jgi:hypothetical protein
MILVADVIMKKTAFSPLALFMPLVLLSCTASDEDEANVAGMGAREVAAAMAKGGLASLAPGKWVSELKVTEIKVPGVAAKRRDKIVAQVEKNGTHDNCLTAQVAKAPPPEFFVHNAKKCVYSKFVVTAGKAAITLSCDMGSVGAVDMDLTGPISADGFRFDADIDFRLPMVGTVPMKAVVTGTQKGDCAKGG